jgi:hypothetical protein
MNIHSKIMFRFATLSLASAVLIGGGCSAGKFAGESKMKKRKQQYISAAERPVEITNRHNIWVVTRDNFVKKWDNLTTTNGQTTITVPDVSGIKVNMTIRGPGLEFGGGSRIAAINGNILTLAKCGQVRYTAPATTGSGTYNVYTGVAHWLSVEGNTIVQRKKWSGIDGNFDFGFRTYVTEGGVLIARFPFVYFIDPDTTPEGLVPDTNIKNFDPSQSYNEHSRICLASYLKGDKRYMIAAVANGKYYEIELSPNKPYKPLWDNLPNPRETADWTYDHGWGYSCHMNQKKKIFYSQWAVAGAKSFVTAGDPKTRQGGAVDLNNYSTVDLDAQIPNAKFIQKNAILSTFSRGPQTIGASYAVAGDPDGNIYNGDYNAEVVPGEKNWTYTMSYQKMSDTVWVSRATNKIGIIKRKCLTTDDNCGPQDFQFQQGPEAVAIGPLSALKDGRLVGIARKGHQPSAVYLLSLNDPANITKGASFHLLAEIDGDAYMYVDFTGATLYTRQVEQTFKVREMPEYVKRQRQNDDRAEKTKEAFFEWTNALNTSADWTNLKLEARCYENASSKGDYQEVKSVAKAGEKTTMNIPACKDKYVEFIDVRISQVTGETLGDINKVRVHITQ